MKLEKKHLEEASKILKSIKEKLNEGPDDRGIDLPDCNLHWDGIKMDSNGNSVVVLSVGSNRPFTIQTNGNLPLTHKSIRGIKGPRWISHTLLDPIRDEIVDYIQKYMPSVKSKLKVYESMNRESTSSKKTKLKESGANDEVDNLIKTFVMYSDSQHGWLQVPRSLLKQLGIERKITHYSYMSRDRKTVYVEEDQDMNTFAKAFESAYGVKWRDYINRIRDSYTDGSSPIRNLPSYQY